MQKIIKPIFENIPKSLKDINQWVLFKVETRNGKETKPPYQVNGQLASVTNKDTYNTFKAVKKAYEKEKTFNGIGFVLSQEEGIVALDLDHCMTNGKPNKYAQGIIDNLNTYTEKSPSGTGIRIFMRSTMPLPTGNKNKAGTLEVYQDKRYVTITGHPLKGRSKAIVEDRTSEMAALHEREFPQLIVKRKEPKPTSAKVKNPKSVFLSFDLDERMAKAYSSANGPKLQSLMNGDMTGYKSQSNADQALCCILAKWLDKDPVLIDQVFQTSMLYRTKWDRQGYKDLTISYALSHTDDVYTEPLKEPLDTEREGGTAGEQRLREAIETPPIQIHTISKLMNFQFPPVIDVISGGILPEAGSLLLAGESEAGKSMLSMEIALHLAIGRQLFNATYLVPQLRKVLVFQCENPFPQVQQRLQRMIRGMGVTLEDFNDNLAFADPVTQYNITKKKSIERMIQVIELYQAEVIILDPLSSFHSFDENDNSKMRSTLDNVTHVSRVTGCACILVHHYGKPQKGRDDSYRLRGASSIKDWADSILSMKRKKHENKELFVLRFDKLRHGRKPKPMLFERNDNFLSILSEEEVMISPQDVHEFLQDEMGGKAESQVELLKGLAAKFSCDNRTALRGVKNAVEMETIKELKGQGKRKKYAVPK